MTGSRFEQVKELICVEPRIKQGLDVYIKNENLDITGKIFVTLAIPDRFRRRDPKLVAIIEKQYQEWISGVSAKP